MNGKHAAEIAKGKAKTPGWKAFRWEVIGEGVGLLVRGAVPFGDNLWGPHEDAAPGRSGTATTRRRGIATGRARASGARAGG